MSTTPTAFQEWLAGEGPLIADGATGTNYQAMGLPLGAAPEDWLFDAPERVIELHEAFIAAGSELILTCSFGATNLRLADGALAGRGREVNLRAAELARAAAGGRVLVAGSMGPTGQLCEPLGPLSADRCAEEFAAQALALSEGGVDLLVLETFFALEEAIGAIRGVQRASELPLVVSFSFDQGTRTMMGLSPTDAVAAVVPLGVSAVGANCGRSLADMDAILPELVSAAAGRVPVWIKPNAGIPRIVGDSVVYDADAETFAAHTRGYVEAGARIVGGCCGSTPAHLEAIARALRAESPLTDDPASPGT
jgi:5-methyltetrahydrofolate--homocysteine methyltransferase